jgi:DNA-binding NarL/FixJ family response regulator
VSVVRVHLADDHTMFREGLASLLKAQPGIEVVGASTTGEEAAFLVEESKPDLVITQLDMDLKSAQEILEGIRSASPDSRIVALTMFDNLRYLKALSKMGIDAYVHKASSSEELIATLDALSRQGSPDGPNAVISMPRGLLERMGEEPPGGLSERELDVLVMAARGLPNDRIAQELHIAPATVKRHLANVNLKIGTRSRMEAVRTAIMEQWVGISEITHADSDGSSGGPEEPATRTGG